MFMQLISSLIAQVNSVSALSLTCRFPCRAWAVYSAFDNTGLGKCDGGPAMSVGVMSIRLLHALLHGSISAPRTRITVCTVTAVEVPEHYRSARTSRYSCWEAPMRLSHVKLVACAPDRNDSEATCVFWSPVNGDPTKSNFVHYVSVSHCVTSQAYTTSKVLLSSRDQTTCQRPSKLIAAVSEPGDFAARASSKPEWDMTGWRQWFQITTAAVAILVERLITSSKAPSPGPVGDLSIAYHPHVLCVSELRPVLPITCDQSMVSSWGVRAKTLTRLGGCEHDSAAVHRDRYRGTSQAKLCVVAPGAGSDKQHVPARCL
nr:hypothetical protein CFP56_36460 [Quercus suber]